MTLSNWFPWRKRESDREKNRKEFIRPLDQPYFYLTKDDYLTGWNFFEHLMVWGGVGSSKTTSTLFHAVNAMIRAGWGGLILTVKENEASRIGWICKQAGREEDFLLVDVSGKNTYNFMVEDAKQGGFTENLCTLLDRASEVLNRANGSGQSQKDPYWPIAARQCKRNLIDFTRLSLGDVSLTDLCELILALPRSFEVMQSANWEDSTIAHMIRKANARSMSESDRHDFKIAADYITREWPALDEKPRSSIQSMVTSVLDPLTRSLLNTLFNGVSTFTPDSVLAERKILCVDLPIKKFYDIGAVAQAVIKEQMQRAIERRGDGTPFFILIDECQEILSAHDHRFMATARSSKCAVLMATQTVNNLYAAFGSEHSGKAIAEAIMGLAQTKVFHQNSCSTTNSWASELIGLRKKRMFNTNCNFNSPPFERSIPNYSAGSSQQFLPAIQPAEFATLLKGGAINKGFCEAIFYQGGRRWSNGETYIRTTMKQGY